MILAAGAKPPAAGEYAFDIGGEKVFGGHPAGRHRRGGDDDPEETRHH